MATLDLFQKTLFILLVVAPISLAAIYWLSHSKTAMKWRSRRAIKKARAEYEKERRSIGW